MSGRSQVSSSTPTAREGALAKLAAEAARFEQPAERPTAAPVSSVAAQQARVLAPAPAPPARLAPQASAPTGYVPVAVAPERGNTRPVVPVDGRLHMRVATQTLTDVDDVVRSWKNAEPVALRDLERATLVRIGLAMVLADIEQNGTDGAVGEAVRAALDPRVRHTDQPMPALSRWLRRSVEDSA